MLSEKDVEDIDRNRDRLRRINERKGVSVVRSLLDEWEAEQEAAQAMIEAEQEAKQARREAEIAAGADLPLFNL